MVDDLLTVGCRSAFKLSHNMTVNKELRKKMSFVICGSNEVHRLQRRLFGWPIKVKEIQKYFSTWKKVSYLNRILLLNY